MNLDDFVALSEALTGVQGLDRDLASDYMARCLANPDVGGGLPPLLTTFRDMVAKGGDRDAAIKSRIMDDAKLGPVAQQVIFLWYVSAFFAKDPADPVKGTWQYGPPQHYPRGLMWSVIHSHAPMTPGGGVDYWVDPPTPSVTGEKP